MKTHEERHLVGKSVTVVYSIVDPTEWRKTNPLNYKHNGIEAYLVSVGDLGQRRDDLRQALEAIAVEGDAESRKIAQDAIDADDNG